MTAWSLLVAISFTAPMFGGLLAAQQSGGFAIFTGLLVGSVIGFGGAWIMVAVGKRITARFKVAPTSPSHALAFVSLYLCALMWILVLAGLAVHFTTYLIHHVVA
jgi:hypothetical protein